jgi:hypothetical protein
MTKASIVRQTLAVLALLSCLFGRPASAADSAIGFVKFVTGTVTALRGGQRIPLAVGAPVQADDEFETGADGTLGVTFRDDTRISLGPNTRLDVSRFVFAPAERQYGLGLKLILGTLQYISGLTGKLSPESVSITTPNFVVAVRGTRLLVRAEK